MIFLNISVQNNVDDFSSHRLPVLLLLLSYAIQLNTNYVINIIKMLLHTLYIVWLQELGPEVIKVFILPHISSLAQKIDIGTHPLILHCLHSTGTRPSKI
jgi:hypothetical protein